MKKVMLISLLFVASNVRAACVGSLCYDDKGSYVSGVLSNGNGAGLPNETKATINANTPDTTGMEVFCTNCTVGNGGKGIICVSTGTLPGAYVAESTGTAVSNCN